MFGIAETARRFGQYRWAELQLFELLGTWATGHPEPRVSPMLAAQAHRHAQHARWFAARVPAVALQGADYSAGLVVGAFPLVPLVERAQAATTTTDLLRAVHDGLLPALGAMYDDHLLHTDPRVDGPTTRVLALARRDLADHHHEGMAMLERLR